MQSIIETTADFFQALLGKHTTEAVYSPVFPIHCLLKGPSVSAICANTSYYTTQISKAIYSPILGQTPKWFRINSFGFITCYRPGSNQFKRNLLFKTYFNSWLWCVNLVDFHFFLKFLNFISISNSQNHLWTLQWRE